MRKKEMKQKRRNPLGPTPSSLLSASFYQCVCVCASLFFRPNSTPKLPYSPASLCTREAAVRCLVSGQQSFK